MPTVSSSSLPSPGLEPRSRIPIFAKRLGSWWISLERQPFDTGELAVCYDAAARGWARKLRRLGVSHAYEVLLTDLVRSRVVAASGPVLQALDCGIGTGGLSAALVRSVREPVALEGIDLSTDMLEEAARTLGQTSAVVRLCQGDVQGLPYADDQFDVVMAGHVLEHLADPTRALAEMVRVLRPGGLLLACLTRSTLSGRWIQMLWRTHRVDDAVAKRWLEGVGLANPICQTMAHNSAYRRLGLACWAHKPGDFDA